MSHAHGTLGGAGGRGPALSALEGREAGTGHLPRSRGVRGAFTTVQALWGVVLTSVPLSPVRGTFNLILHQRKGRPFAQGHGELAELGFELGTVSSKALALGAKEGFGGSHNCVTSLKNHEEWRGACSDWIPSPTSRPGRKPGFLLSLVSLKQNQEDFALSYQYSLFPDCLWDPVQPPSCVFLSEKWG